MADKTTLVLPGRKFTVSKVLKRTLQIAVAVSLTSLLALVVVIANGMLIGRGATLQAGVATWLSFIKRPDIQTTMLLTAVVSVLLVYWQRDHEKR
ncbi:MAG TPA: hypothetical protein PK264_03745 [Hyphomicrobiaceae bacterium]|nr:hypothetical protein [Hyphomicrobiaceae bacterium]